jgi:uncharacterized C2H2 Zn-finger protein
MSVRRKKTNANSKCDFCDKTFYERNLFYGHARKHHMDIIAGAWVECDICSTLYPDAAIVARHKSTVHHSSKAREGDGEHMPKVSCEFCDQVFRQPRTYYSHCNANHVDSIRGLWHQCAECEAFFPDAKTLRFHKQASSCNDRDASQGYQCDFCPAVLSKNYIYFQHANRKHMDMISGTWVPCTKCDLLLPTEHHVAKHNSNKHPSKDGPRNAMCRFYIF